VQGTAQKILGKGFKAAESSAQSRAFLFQYPATPERQLTPAPELLAAKNYAAYEQSSFGFSGNLQLNLSAS
jgi:hypothetical protein